MTLSKTPFNPIRFAFMVIGFSVALFIVEYFLSSYLETTFHLPGQIPLPGSLAALCEGILIGRQQMSGYQKILSTAVLMTAIAFVIVFVSHYIGFQISPDFKGDAGKIPLSTWIVIYALWLSFSLFAGLSIGSELLNQRSERG